MKSRGRSQPKALAQQSDDYEDNNETVFKHYDNKSFDVDFIAEDPKPCTVPVPEIQELQQYVTNCYNSLYKDFNAFKSSVTNQLLSLQEEVQTLSLHNSGRNEDVFPEAVKESPSQYGLEAIQGRTDELFQWHSKAQVEDYEECEKPVQFHHNARLHPCSGGRSPAPREEQHLGKRASHQIEDDLIQHIPANAWSTKVTNQAGAQFPNAPERGQEATYLSRHLHRSPSPNTGHELQQQQSKSWGSKTRPGWSPEKSNERLTISTSWQEQVDVESKDYDETEEENKQAIEKMVSEYCTHQSHNNGNGVRDKDQDFSHGQSKAGGVVGKDRFTLHGWAASFLQQPSDVRLPKVNKQYVKQENHRLNDKGRTSKLVACDDMRDCELQMEQSVAEMEITSKRSGVALGEGSLSRSNSEDLKQVYDMSRVNLHSSKSSAGDREKRDTTTGLNQQNSDKKFPGKKCRGGIAWTVHDLADQNKQRTVK